MNHVKLSFILFFAWACASLIQMYASEWTGTGFAISDRCVVTNYHVVEDANSLMVRVNSNDSLVGYYATVLSTNQEHDLAIIRISDQRFHGFGSVPYSVRTEQAEVGESIFILGYPLTSTMGSEMKLTTGVISSHSGFQGDRTLYQISAAVQPGNSGGPLVDDGGRVVGVVNAKHLEAENVGYSVKACYLGDLVRASEGVQLPAGTNMSSFTLPQKVSSFRPYVVLIEGSTRPSQYYTYPDASTEKSTPKPQSPSARVLRTYNTPEVTYVSSNALTVKKVEIMDAATCITLVYRASAGDMVGIHPNTVLMVGNRKLQLSETDKMAILPQQTSITASGNYEFKLYFPKVSEDSQRMSIVEPGTSGWQIIGIQLK